MTENLPDLRGTATELATPVAKQDTDSWIGVVNNIAALSGQIAGTEVVPKDLRGKPAAVAAAILYGREVGLPPMTALTQTHVIEGKPSLSAEGMRALILAAGHVFEIVETSGALCKMRARRRGSDQWTEILWTIEMARAAGLLTKTNWKSYPRQMLQARCTGELARLVFPDVIHGFAVVEEMEDTADGEGPAEALTAIGTGGGTTVRRTGKTAAKKASPAATLREGAQQRRAAGTVPLPGEDGYEELVPEGAAAGGAAAAPTAPEPAGDATSTPASPVDEGGSEGSPAETSGAEGEAGSTPAGATSEPPLEEEESEDRYADAVGPGEELPLEQGQVVEDQEPREQLASKKQVTAMRMALYGLGLTGEENRDRRLEIYSRIIGRDLDSSTNCTVGEASAVIDTIARVRTLVDLDALLDAMDADR